MSQETTSNLDLINDVPDTGGAFKNFGKLSINTRFLKWTDGKPTEITATEWQKLPKTGGKGMELIFGVDIQEFKPALEFTYQRKVTVDGSDWYKTVAPSIEALMGKGSMEKGDTAKGIAPTRNKTLNSLIGKYVAVEDVPQQPRKNAAPDAKQFNTIKFVKVYATREECYAELQALSPSNGTEAGVAEAPHDPMVPEGYSKSDWLSMKNDPDLGVATAVSKAIAEATSKNKGKPKPVMEKAIAAARASAIETVAKQLDATVEQVEHLLNS
jgi:hypothetical protein